MTELSFNEKGDGHAVLLIHGFPMNAEIWRNFVNVITPRLKAITIDLPGFGKSPLIDKDFSIDDVAEVVLENLEKNGVSTIVPIGHSLGGYVVLAMVNKKPSMFPGFCLFHSTVQPDSAEKKGSRNKVLEFIKTNGAKAFTSNFIAPLFSNPDHPDVTFVREMNMKTDATTLIEYTKAMRDRPDRMELLKKFKKPILIIAGGRDPGIPLSSIEEMATASQFPIVRILPDQAHMALIEDVQTTSAIVYDFVLKCYS